MNETFLQNIISNNNLSILHELCISPLLYLDWEYNSLNQFQNYQIPKQLESQLKVNVQQDWMEKNCYTNTEKKKEIINNNRKTIYPCNLSESLNSNHRQRKHGSILLDWPRLTRRGSVLLAQPFKQARGSILLPRWFIRVNTFHRVCAKVVRPSNNL